MSKLKEQSEAKKNHIYFTYVKRYIQWLVALSLHQKMKKKTQIKREIEKANENDVHDFNVLRDLVTICHTSNIAIDGARSLSVEVSMVLIETRMC